MNPADLIREAQSMGAELYLDGECLRCRPGRLCPNGARLRERYNDTRKKT